MTRVLNFFGGLEKSVAVIAIALASLLPLIAMGTRLAGIRGIPGSVVFDHLEAECALHIEHEPKFTLCARALGQVFSVTRDFGRARKWLGRRGLQDL